MLNSELNKVLNEFKHRIQRSFELVQSVDNVRPRFPQDQVYMIYELSFLRIFLSWEWFLESTFILYMLGVKTDSGYGPTVYVQPKDQLHAYEFVKEGRDYVDWTNLDAVIRKSDLFFKDGEPFKGVFQLLRQEMQDIKTVRNAIVHTSAEAKRRFESLIRTKLGYAREGITPGDLLATIVADKDMSYITYYSELLQLASEQIVKHNRS